MDVIKSFEAKETLYIRADQGPIGVDTAFTVFKSPNIAAKLMHIRSRLAHLTKENELMHTQNWHTSVRDVAAHLRDALEKAATYMFVPPQSTTEEWPWKSQVNDKEVNAIIWGANCHIYEGTLAKEPQRNPILFSISKQRGRWEIDQNQLEAVLGLWSWSVKRLAQMSESKMGEPPESYLKAKRLLVESSKFYESESMLRSWVTNNYAEDFSPWVLTKDYQRLRVLQSSLLSIPVATSMFCGLTTDTRGLQIIKFNADSPLLCIMAQDIFTFFLQEASLLLSQHSAQNPNANFVTYFSRGFFRNSHVESLIDILQSTKLATREEALISIVPALFKADVLPNDQLLCFNLLSRARSLRMEDEFRQSESILSQLNSLKLIGMEMTIQRAMGQLVLAECSSIVVNLWKMRKSEATNMISDLIYTFENWKVIESETIYKISDWAYPFRIEKLEMEEGTKYITKCYMDVVIWLTSSSKVLDQPVVRADYFEHLGLFFNKLGGPEISNKKPTNMFPYHEKPDFEYGFILALTFQHRFDICDSTMEDRKQILRWAIEFGYPELIACLWILEKRFQLQGSAFSGGPDEVFWTINGSYSSFIKIDILHFLVTVTELDLIYSESGYFCLGDKRDEDASNVGLNEQQALDAFCEAHTGWRGGHNIESSKRMLKAYQDYGNILTAAVSTPNSWNMVKLLVEHGDFLDEKGKLYEIRDNKSVFGPSGGKYKTLLEATVICADFATVEYIAKIYPSSSDFDDDLFFALESAGEWGRADCFELFVRKLEERNKQDSHFSQNFGNWLERIAKAAKKADGTDRNVEDEKPYWSNKWEIREFYERWIQEPHWLKASF